MMFERYPTTKTTSCALVPPRLEVVSSLRRPQALPQNATRFWPLFFRDRDDRNSLSKNGHEGQPAHTQYPVNSETQVDNHRAATILVVEDEMIVALDLQHVLRRMGYRVVGIASTGKEAVLLAATSHPDVILMDIHLKDNMDGIEAAKQIVMHHKTAIIYLTAQADESTLQRVEETGPVDLLFKPFSEPTLQATIEEALSFSDD